MQTTTSNSFQLQADAYAPCAYRLPAHYDDAECWSGNCILAATELEWARKGFGIPFAVIESEDDVDPLPEADESPKWTVRGKLRAWFGMGW